jgi:DNA-binding FrmR family transcriptional regulator
MLSAGRSCEDVEPQLLAVRTAIERIASEFVTTHIDECLTRLPPEEARATIGRASKTLAHLD